MSTPRSTPTPRRWKWLLTAVAVAALGGCGGGDSSPPPDGGPFSCSIAGQKSWLRDYFHDWYFWYAFSPSPDPAPYASVEDYFKALKYTGTDPNFPADRWSGYESSASFTQYYEDGQTLGYGIAVAGREVSGQPSQPLYVRYVEPLSPAAGRVLRGDQVLSINGRTAAELIAADDFSVLTSSAAGQTIALKLRNSTGDRDVTVASAIFALSPVPLSRVITTPGGRKLGYVMVNSMIDQARMPLAQTFTGFRNQGVTEAVLDLRYNGGGLVEVARTVASYIAGWRGENQVFARLLYSDKQAAKNRDYVFERPANEVDSGTVYVLMGRRTCSASEQVINGLRGIGVNVVAIGETTCGKPVGFQPQPDGCGTTYSIVNFESVTWDVQLRQWVGRYFDGFQATCAVAENFTKPLGADDDPLLAAARWVADTGTCPVAATREQPLSLRKATRGTEPGERQGMIPR